MPTARFGLAGAAAPCPGLRHHHMCIYAIGGTPNNGQTLFNTVEAFDIDTAHNQHRSLIGEAGAGGSAGVATRSHACTQAGGPSPGTVSTATLLPEWFTGETPADFWQT
ncbi:kelch motif-containing protein [Streptomyces sp. NBC_01619]|uniref:Kelch repeat-containing protein n=1 Tax=Streptomyces sp. NBC_01619 TaxID=2975901 RepID=UPI00225A0C10|nr:kelch repeat-containing protein [Streptomyces sp. NBC_01619]MCX4515853.1 kelch motif-containing protein [Streptomyces sp. NBC_01619]